MINEYTDNPPRGLVISKGDGKIDGFFIDRTWPMYARSNDDDLLGYDRHTEGYYPSITLKEKAYLLQREGIEEDRLVHHGERSRFAQSLQDHHGQYRER